MQRVSQASVSVTGEVVGDIGPGLLILVCAMQGDSEAQAARLADKIAKLRIFRDADGRMNLSVKDTGGAALIVSQFTLAADLRGTAPAFFPPPPRTKRRWLYDRFCQDIAANAIPVGTGRFGADMAVTLTNDGPVTIWLNTVA